MLRTSLLSALSVVAVLTVVTPAAHAADLLADPVARLFTVADAPGATVFASDGVAATGRRAAVRSLGALPSGDLVFTDDHDYRKTGIWRVDSAGVLRSLPGGRGAIALAVEPGGTIVAALQNTHRLVRVSADGATRTAVADLSGQPGARAVTSGDLVAVATLPGGALAAADGEHIWRITSGGAVTAIVSGVNNVSAMTASADGTVVYFSGSDDKVRRAAPGGGIGELVTTTQAGSAVALSPLPDGSVLMSVTGFLDDASGTLEVLDPRTGARTLVGGRAPGFGNGDGGPLAGVATSAVALTATPDGGVAFAERGAQGDTPLRRLAGPGLSTQTLAAFDQTAFGLARASATAVLTSVPGRVTVQVRSVASGKVIRTVRASAATGVTRLTFRPVLPHTDLTQTLRFTPAGAGTVTARIGVSTRTSLPARLAYKVLDARFQSTGGGDDEAGYGTERGRCRRITGRRLDCQVRNYEEHYRPYKKTSTCAQTVRVRLRADGVRLQFVAGCRA